MGRDAPRADLQRFLSEKLGRAVTLARFSHSTKKSVFKMDDPQGPVFVKVKASDYNGRTARFLAVADLPFLPKVRFHFDCGARRSVLGLDWQEGRIVLPENMSAAQCSDLTRAYGRLQAELKKADADRLPPMDVDAHMRTLAGVAARQPWTRPFLKKLLALPADEWRYDPATAVTIVSDFHCRNYAFVGEKVSAMFDFDRLRLGSPVEDLAYAIIRRYRKKRLSRVKLRAVRERFLQMVAESPWPKKEWRRAINVCRLDAAAKWFRGRARPLALLSAYHAWSRDRPLAELAELIGERCVS